MSDIAIRVRGLGKQYRIGKRERYRTLRDTLADTVRVPFQWTRSLFDSSPAAELANPSDLFWALKDVSFDVPKGAVLGVIGRNGAGKSTLLKVLSRITEPTEGRVEIHGRVGSLLEVGTGFHPELTGRENVFLNGAILGMRRVEIARQFDEIIAFAEVERFVDTPVKHYSSGMYMRLAFAVAAHLDPEILVVDEVLAVGDLAFQQKCLGKIGQVATKGRTVLFVSHNMAAVSTLCNLAAHLDGGRIAHMGAACEVVRAYVSVPLLHPVEQWSWFAPSGAPGDEVVQIRSVRIVDNDGKLADRLEIAASGYIVVDYQLLSRSAPINVSLSLYTDDDIYVLASPSTSGVTPAVPVTEPGVYRSRCRIPENLLNEGNYSVTVLLVKNMAHVVATLERVVHFSTYDMGSDRAQFFGRWGGVVRPMLSWETIRLDPFTSDQGWQMRGTDEDAALGVSV